MNFPYEWQIGWRYTRAGKRTTGNGFISFIALVSMAGIALGVAALIVVLSVMNGFQREVRDRMLSVLPHVQIMSAMGTMPDWQQVTSAARRNPNVLGAAPYVSAQALLTHGDSVSGVALTGIDPALQSQVSEVGNEMKAGSLSSLVPGDFGIVLGTALADSLGVMPGDRVTLVAPEGSITPAGMMPRLKQFTVVGVFSSGEYQYDNLMGYINIHDAQALLRLNAPSGVQLRIKDMQRAPEMTQALAQPGALPLDNEATLDVCNRLNESMIQTAQQAIQMLLKEAVSANPARLAELSAIEHESTARMTALSAVDPANPAEGLRLCEGIKGFRPVPYMLSDWTQQNKTWFSAVKLEKRMMFIILALIIAVAAFNLVSSLVMTVTNKQADIAILRTLGAQPGSIMLIFLVQGMTIGLIGTVTGVALGSLIAWSIPWTVPFLERLFHHQFLPPSVYFITELPSELVAMDVLRIGVMSFILSALATLYPSWRASTVRPAEALRYE